MSYFGGLSHGIGRAGRSTHPALAGLEASDVGILGIRLTVPRV
jgi:hypothetical protein